MVIALIEVATFFNHILFRGGTNMKRDLGSTREKSFSDFIGILFPFVVLSLLVNPQIERR
jgi:hypothetical protein